jgi:uncharacterized protein
MPYFHFLFVTWVAILFLPFNLNISTDNNPPIQALLITGGGWHDYETQESLLIDGINERTEHAIEWTIVHEGDGEPDHHASVLKEENWTDGYDIIVHNTGFGRVTDPDFVAQFVEHHQGTPAVIIHASIHSYRYAEPADPWFRFMGFQSMWHESQRPFEVETIAPDHPIMQGVPATWTTPDDEIYVVEELWGEITPLAHAWGEETEEYQIVAWTHEFNNTKVFATTLGHNNDMFEREEFLTKVTNGFLWAIDRL